MKKHILIIFSLIPLLNLSQRNLSGIPDQTTINLFLDNFEKAVSLHDKDSLLHFLLPEFKQYYAKDEASLIPDFFSTVTDEGEIVRFKLDEIDFIVFERIEKMGGDNKDYFMLRYRVRLKNGEQCTKDTWRLHKVNDQYYLSTSMG